MPYIFVAIIVTSFASGYGFAYKVSKAEIREMSESISDMNREAEVTLATLTEEAEKANVKAIQLNKELEDANESAIKAINTQRDDFSHQRMYDNGRKSGSCTTTKAGDSTKPIDLPDDGRLSEEFSSFLKSEAYRADQVSAYAILCKNFIQGLNRDR
jgi:hypothetical protein